METIYRFVDDVISARGPDLTAIADEIWDHPETRFEEFWSAERLASALEAEGFSVVREAGGIPNAFIASVGHGRPVIAVLGEYDALAGLSQRARCAEPAPAAPGANGHGCGHNLLGTAGVAAAIAAKAWLAQRGGAGTLRFYGCPGEEGGSGKTFMVREGLFDDVDAAVTWHPEAFAGMFTTSTLANIQAAWRFTGVAAHAANSPHLGRSALDAVTLMTTGSNFLNEHIIEQARVHYAITDTGGISPNVVQARAEVLYLIRAPEMRDAQAIYERIEKIAQGAALMTETRVSCRFEKACSSYLPNRTLERAMYAAMTHYGTPEWSDEERAFAADIRATLSDSDLENSLLNIARTGGEEGKPLPAATDRPCWSMKSHPGRRPIARWQVRRTSATSAGKRRWPSASAPALPSARRCTPGSWSARGAPPSPTKACCWRQKSWPPPPCACLTIPRCWRPAGKSWRSSCASGPIAVRSRKA